MKENIESLTVTSTAFCHEGYIPKRYTGRGDNISPELHIGGLSRDAVSLAVVMEDLDIPVVGICTHWLIWNLPVQDVIPEGISHGETVAELGGAVQGIGFGRNRYSGPKPPGFIRKAHRYRFHVYALDCRLELAPVSKRRDFKRAVSGHVLQHGCLVGLFQNGSPSR